MSREHPNVALSRKHFERLADEYDDRFVRNFHAYDEMHEIILAMLPFARAEKVRCLELGVGTGNLTRRILRRYPRSEFVGYDLSRKMLQKARPKLAFAGSRVTLHCADIGQVAFLGPFDAVVTAVAVHHVPPRSKPKLFLSLFDILRPGGVVLIGDVFRAPSPELDERYGRITAKAIERRGADREGHAEFLRRAGKSGGSSARVEDYARWLRQAGFANVDCVWKHFHLGVLYAEKPKG